MTCKERMVDIKVNSQQEISLKLMNNMVGVMSELLVHWAEAGNENDMLLCESYPFKKTFDDLLIDIVQWRDDFKEKCGLQGPTIKFHEDYSMYSIASPTDVSKYLGASKDFLEVEHLKVLWLNRRNRVFAEQTLLVDELERACSHEELFFEEALKNSCESVIVVRIKPNEYPAISSADIELASKLKEDGAQKGICLIDYLISSNNKFVSIREKYKFV